MDVAFKITLGRVEAAVADAAEFEELEAASAEREELSAVACM